MADEYTTKRITELEELLALEGDEVLLVDNGTSNYRLPLEVLVGYLVKQINP